MDINKGLFNFENKTAKKETCLFALRKESSIVAIGRSH